MCRLLTLLCVVNRAVSTLCRRGQAPDAESEDQKGKVPPPPPGSHDARARWGEAGVMVVGRGSGEGKPPRYKCSTTRHLTQGTGWVCRSKQFTEVQWEKPGSRGKKKKKKIASPPRVQRDAAGCHFKTEAVKNFSFRHQTSGGQRSGEKRTNTCVG